MVGKVRPEDLAAHVFERTGAVDPAVVQGPAYGEDAAAIDLGERTLVASSDPISLAAERAGTLGVHVACNDVAASGADPEWLTSVVFLPEESEATLDAVTTQLDRTAADLGVSIVGGHSEYLPALSRPLLSLTCLGTADEFVPTAGAEVGDDVVLTKGAGIEGTGVLATDFADVADVTDGIVERAEGFFEEVSVVPDAAVLRGRATAMHDPTEGGVLTGLFELASASGVRIDVGRDAVPIREETRRLCDAMDVDPLRIFGSGGLVATVPPDATEATLRTLADDGIDAAVVGRVREDDPVVVLDGKRIDEPVRDDMYRLWE